MTRVVEIASESLPQGLLQLCVALSTGWDQLHSIQLTSLTFSFLTTGFVGAKNSRRWDEDEVSRQADPIFFGYYPRDGTRATLLEIGETVTCIGSNVAKLLSLGTLINAAPIIAATWQLTEATLFLIWRASESEWRFGYPGMDNAPASLFAHFLTHLTLVAYPNTPCRQPGAFYGPHRFACMYVGTLFFINPGQLMLGLYLSDAYPSLSIAPINFASHTMILAWAAGTFMSMAGTVMMFVFMSESHRKTFYQRIPVRKHVREYHWHSRTTAKLGEGQDAARAQTILAYTECYLPQAEVKVWLREGWPEWAKTNPVWFTEYWKKIVHRRLKHLLPAEVFATLANEQYVAKLERLMEPSLIAVDVAELEDTLPNAEDAGVSPELLSRARALQSEASKKQALVTSGVECDFYFVRAECIVACTDKVMPAFRELRRDRPDWLVNKTITFAGACAGTYCRTYLAVSHRWEDPQVPDGLGVQMDAIRQYLRTNPSIKYVFYVQARDRTRGLSLLACCSRNGCSLQQDWSSMPQAGVGKSRTPSEEREFRAMLPNISLLYLGMSVLVLMDLSYLSRLYAGKA
jgi:hypothetical protein